MPKSNVIQVILPNEGLEYIRNRAELQHISQSAVIRQVVMTAMLNASLQGGLPKNYETKGE